MHLHNYRQLDCIFFDFIVVRNKSQCSTIFYNSFITHSLHLTSIRSISYYKWQFLKSMVTHRFSLEASGTNLIVSGFFIIAPILIFKDFIAAWTIFIICHFIYSKNKRKLKKSYPD